MRRVGYEIAGGVEDGAGEVESFFDVCADTCFLKRTAHLFGDGHESVAEDAEHDGVDLAIAFDGVMRSG